MDQVALQRIKELETQRSKWNIAAESMNCILNYVRQCDLHEVLEIGTFNGYSALNFSLLAKQIITLEKDSSFAAQAQKNLQDIANIKLIHDDAIKVLTSFNQEPQKYQFDCIFIDAKKSEYATYLKLSIPLLRDTGIIFVDNTISHKHKLTEFFEELEKSKLSAKELGIGDGLMMLLKTRKYFDSRGGAA